MNATTRPTLMIVDDDSIVRDTLTLALEADFSIGEAESGEKALTKLTSDHGTLPDLVLLDIEMMQLDGYETCRRLRAAGYTMPVIFVSAHDTLDERLRAFDAGGDDFISKPFVVDVLKRKAERAVARHIEAQGLQDSTRHILHEVGETGVMLDFLRAAIRTTDFEALAKLLLDAVGEYGIHCNVQVRYGEGMCTLTPKGAPSELELSILEQATTLGESFRFGRRLIINHHFVSLLVLDMPSTEDHAHRLIDYLNVLSESAEAIAETIDMRQESAGRAETLMVASAQSYSAIEELRDGYRKQQADTRVLLQELIDEVERTYVHLGLTDRQEDTVSSTMRHSADKILRLFEQGVSFERQFATVLDALQPRKNNAADVWL